jgi:hypothetical protein
MWRFHARCTLACTRACVRALLRCPLLLILFVCPRGTPGVDRTAYHHMSLVSQSLRRTLRRKQRFPSFFALLRRGQKHDSPSLHAHPIDRATLCAAQRTSYTSRGGCASNLPYLRVSIVAEHGRSFLRNVFSNPIPALTVRGTVRKSVAIWRPDPLGVSPPRLTLRLGQWWGLNIMLGAAAGVAARPPKTPFLGPISRGGRRVRKLDLGRVFTVL